MSVLGSVVEEVPTYWAQQVRDAEVPYLEAGVSLMARASSALAEVAGELLTLDRGVKPRVLILAGSGNNGGDALYAGAVLADRGAEVLVLPVATRWHEGGMEAALEAGARVIGVVELEGLVLLGSPVDLVIDGILGTGTSGDPRLRGVAGEVVDALVSWRVETGAFADAAVIAVDVPSGMHPDTGVMSGPVLAADVTVTFGGVKHGLVSGEACEVVGDLVLVDIGIGRELAAMEPAGHALVRRVVSTTP